MNQLEIETSLKRGSRVILSLAGSFRANHVSKLLMLVQSAQNMGLRVILSLARLKSADRDAVRSILNWRYRGVRIVHCPAYIREWLCNEEEVCESPGEPGQADAGGGHAESTPDGAIAEAQLARNSKEVAP